MEEHGTPTAEPAIPKLLEISNAMVGLHKERFGRGPTKARTHVFDDLVICVLEGGLTRVERTLQEHGREQIVEDTRAELQHALRDEMVALVERAFGRTVRSFMSATDSRADVQIEAFLLASEIPEPRAAARPESLRERVAAAQQTAHEMREEQRALRAEQKQVRESLHHHVEGQRAARSRSETD
jgi:uncharacterized protein YbcI